ncbi:MAG TPA: epoxide hydrolase [Terriglobales bacterium]|nr:epoxide hydrolase [Terriglobales bacterium]
MSDFTPFAVHFDDAILEDLHRRLEATRFPDQIPDSGWDYGTDTAYLRELVGYWREHFDWRAQEGRINRMPQWTTLIDGQRIHFAHVRSPHVQAMPLLLLHGWPGSIVEFLKVVEPLTEPEKHGGTAADAFHLVVPSLPGYGFSEVTRTRQWDVMRMAEAFAELMRRLGYQRYGAQGGDWGALITSTLGVLDATHLAGIHVNMPYAIPGDRDGLSEREQADLADFDRFQNDETGYQRIQGSKPQTLGVALNDSPAGLAAWIVEKLRTWTDCGGEVETVVSKDEILTNVMVYWASQTITSSMRLYYEVFKGGRVPFLFQKVEVPTGIARFPKEIARFPRRWLEGHYHITHWTDMPRGGHFAALEQPELFAADVQAFFRTVR